MLIDGIAPLSGTTVGVAMPISISFTSPVKVSARKQVEEHIRLKTSVPVTGAWHWFGSQRADFRPRTFWRPGTTVSMVASFNHVGDGYGRYGTHSYTRTFKVGADVRTHVYVRTHKTVVTRNGKVLRTMPSDAGSPDFPSWDGTMAVVDKSRTVRMTSCSVQIACDKKDPNFYDLTLPWDVRVTNSGTFLHYSTGDPYPGHSYGLARLRPPLLGRRKWYYNLSKQGDPVTMTGSPRGKASGRQRLRRLRRAVEPVAGRQRHEAVHDQHLSVGCHRGGPTGQPNGCPRRPRLMRLGYEGPPPRVRVAVWFSTIRWAMSRTLVLECEELRTRNPKAASESRPYCAISSPTAWPMTSRVRRAWLRWSTSLALPSASAAWVANRSAIPGAWGSIASDSVEYMFRPPTVPSSSRWSFTASWAFRPSGSRRVRSGASAGRP